MTATLYLFLYYQRVEVGGVKSSLSVFAVMLSS